MSLLGTTVTGLLDLYKTKKLSPREAFSYFEKRIQRFNSNLNVYLTTVSSDQVSFENTGLLANVPLAIKDNFCTNGLRTTASAKVLDTFVPPYDATVIERLKNEGMIITGKTNMDAWAHGSSTETSDYGPTKNPWNTSRAPGGSSGGSAAAPIAYLAPAGIGSETAGSIRLPASWCGIVGLKPSYGRVSRYGVIAMGSSLDCPGPLTLSVEDAALLLQVIAGKDPFDATTADIPVPDYRTEMKKKRTMTIGVSEEYLDGVDEDVKKSYETSLKILEKMGHTIKPVELISPQYAISVYTIIQRAEVSSNLARYDGIRYGNNRASFGSEAKRRIMLGTYTLSHGYYDAFYKKAQKVRTLIIQDFKRVFKEVDVIFAPTTPITALPLGEFEQYPFFGEKMDVLNEPAAVAGIPAINIPTGLDRNGLPVGMQFMGNYFEEGTLLDIAYQFEQETKFFDVIRIGVEKYRD
jgi:aspartyl-tRNA(Asn)/glutamyl-tRNA(Gln) amidotransferase subunit A